MNHAGKRILSGTAICMMLAYFPGKKQASSGVPRQSRVDATASKRNRRERIEHRQQINQQRCWEQIRAIPQQIHTPTVASPRNHPQSPPRERGEKEPDRSPRRLCAKSGP